MCAFIGGCKGGHGVRTPPENYKNIGFLSNKGPHPLKNHKATKPAVNFGSLSARQRSAIKMAFRWRADDGPLLVAIGSSLPHHLKNLFFRFGPLWQKSLDPRMYFYVLGPFCSMGLRVPGLHVAIILLRKRER